MKVTPKDSIEEKNAREKRIKERRMKHKKTKKRFQFLKNPFFWFLLFMAYVLYVGHNQTKLLNDNYKITTGYIYERGLRGHLHYYFNVYSAEFHGGSNFIKGKEVGDTLQVRYYVPNPAINRWEGEFH
jgi:hypothetical protein